MSLRAGRSGTGCSRSRCRRGERGHRLLDCAEIGEHLRGVRERAELRQLGDEGRPVGRIFRILVLKLGNQELEKNVLIREGIGGRRSVSRASGWGLGSGGEGVGYVGHLVFSSSSSQD